MQNKLNSLLETRTAGDPDDEDVVFTNMSATEIARLVSDQGTPVSDKTITRLLDEAGLGFRKIVKNIAGGLSPDRGLQFDRISELIDEYTIAGNPCFSMDTKAKEQLGLLFRAGRVRTTAPFRAFDHDFPSWADGVIIPHGIYDPQRNRGHINIGLSHDTSEFATASFRWYWNRIGKQCYPDATSILLLCDGGGSNSASKYIFKHDLQLLSDSIGVEIRVAHYPSYCSKYNLIERRFFPHISRACSGMLFDSLQTVVALMRRASTQTGLRTTVNVIHKLFETGRNATKEMKDNLQIIFDDVLPKWNYKAIPISRQ